MSVMEQKVVHTIQWPSDRLAVLGYSISQAAMGAGCDANIVDNLVRTHIRAQCVLCGLQVSGEELQLLSDGNAAKSDNPKLGRLILGYCARAGCGSKFYSVHFLDHSVLSWPSIVASAESIAPPEAQPVNAEPVQIQSDEPANKTFLPKPVIKIILALALLFFAVQTVRYFTGGRIPLLQPKHHYTINPDSVRPHTK